MPYIDPAERPEFDDLLKPILSRVAHGKITMGQLNYLITKIAIAATPNPHASQKISYQAVHDIKGVLGDVYDEYRRRMMDEYEDRKIEANGDVYPPFCLRD